MKLTKYFLWLLIFFYFIFSGKTAFAGTISPISDTLSTSTPSVPAMHKIQFKIPTAVPASGKIIIIFPGLGVTTATPSATTFSFNGLTSANAPSYISYSLGEGQICTFTVSAPRITCTTDTGGSIPAGTTITFLIGCADASTNATTCVTQSPRLINPTKKRIAGTGDTWTVNVKTQDGSAVDQDFGTTKISTIESGQTQASVDPTFTFTIKGINNGVPVNTGNTTGCTNTELTTSGTDSTATAVNLGSFPVLSTIAPTIAAQILTITTNAFNGYSLTATSSGHLTNSETSYAIADSTTPAGFPSGNPWFGIHACGTDVNPATWGASSTTTTRGGTAKYGWPTNTTALTLATSASGPIMGTNGSGLTTVEYAAAVDTAAPSGTYTTTINYIATPTF